MADLYPGWDKFKETLDELDKLRKDEGHQKMLAAGFEAVLKDFKENCGCKVTKDNILDAMKKPQGKNYDWSKWKGKIV